MLGARQRHDLRPALAMRRNRGPPGPLLLWLRHAGEDVSRDRRQPP
jgi:hypothetical protein